MRVARYMKKHGLSQREFALKLGVTQSTVSQWVTGRIPISPEMAVAIEKKTGGEIKRADLRRDIFGA